ncbi:response regulator [Haliscomenobacter hydrossis]|uniref:Two component transcriptional regulator, LuxR family n=1 Tax=Haliscomenobacter hydrossis (strain ATCC 27775 / DSM 1100 / LMG 10767 / O) TaxID=760192 RepID=F4KYL0_HALH1|nr:response regulator transcription factor [Haliscomenobacter hydrossis]AEE50416.1 two component transcriptional regulator, LuxR family [Haliscomenobacter hydrossis DSM 1100]
MEKINLAIVEDDPLIRESLENFLTEHPSLKIGLIAKSMEEFLEAIKDAASRPALDLLLLDIELPGMSGIQGIYHIKQKYPDLDIVMLTTFEEEEKIFNSLCAGACSYISKRTPLVTIREAIFTVHRGGSYMSPSIARKIAQHFMPKERKEGELLSLRQKEIVQGIVDGLSYKMIADKLDISIDTVRDHIKRIYRALEVNSKAEVIRKSLEGEI